MPEGNGDRLDGWKEIAAYLNRSVRSAQRWNQELGLPVHRVQGRKGNIVYALRSEIDEWLLAIETPADDDALSEEGMGQSRRWLLCWAVCSSAAAVVGWGLLTIFVAGGDSALEFDPAAPTPGNGDIPQAAASSNENGRDFPLPRGLIVFASSRDGNNEIYVNEADGSQV